MHSYQLYWGELHRHLEDLEDADMIVAEAALNCDFYLVLYYPFTAGYQKGLHIEAVGAQPEHAEEFEIIRRVTKKYNQPGKFVTFLGYEWHGDRTAYGDHNVLYLGDDDPLDPAASLEQLYENLRKRHGLAIPHHTGYAVGNRGKDWRVFDEQISPVMEIFSLHGSSEGCDTPLPMSHYNMGPRVTGGCYLDALKAGCHVGCIAASESTGLPCSWAIGGNAAVWAEELTRQGIVAALRSRRTYAVTSDRIAVQFFGNGQPMGSIIPAKGPTELTYDITGCSAIDRVEVIRNGRVFDSYSHALHHDPPREGQAFRFKVRIECGWGPTAEKGFQPVADTYDNHVRIKGGRLLAVQPCFSNFGQRLEHWDEHTCHWKLQVPRRRDDFLNMLCIEGIIFEIEGRHDTRLTVDVDGTESASYSVEQMLAGSHLIVLLDESKHRIWDTFQFTEADIANRDAYFHNARKCKVHMAVPGSHYTLHRTVVDDQTEPGENWYYLRVQQTNGQYAWTSPIWVRP